MTNLKYTLPFALLALCACGEEDTTDTATIGIDGQDTAVNVVGDESEAETFAEACGSPDPSYDPQMYSAVVGCALPAAPPPCAGTLTTEQEYDVAGCIALTTIHCGDDQNLDTIEITQTPNGPTDKAITQYRDGVATCVYVEEQPESLQCPDLTTQIDPSWLCDGAQDCPSGGDETGC